jgi:hypothetical protein
MNQTPIVISELAKLRSRKIRILNTQNLQGERTVDITASSDGSNPGITTATGNNGGILGAITTRLQQFAGFLFQQVLNFVGGTLTQLATGLVSAYMELKSFDWNSSDEEIRQQIQKNNESLVLGSGDTLGLLAGWGLVYLTNLAVGATLGIVGRLTGNDKLRGSSIATGIKVPVLSGKIATALAEEGGDELRGELQSFLNRAKSVQVQNSALASILAARKMGFMKSISNPDLPVDSFVSRQEDFIKKRVPEKWQDWAEDFIDSFEEAVLEAFYVVTETIDDHLASLKFNQYQRQQNQQVRVFINESESENDNGNT